LSMGRTLRQYFHQLDPNNTWIRNPFLCDIEKIKKLSKQEPDEFIDLVNNRKMKNIYNDNNQLIVG